MSDTTRVSGTIRITPPVPAHRLAGSGFAPGPAQDDELAVRLCTTDTADGVGCYDAVGAAVDEDGRMQDAHQLVPHLNQLVTLIGPGHHFDGVLSCAGPTGDEDLWRVRVVHDLAIDEHAEVMDPADWTALAGPAVSFDPVAARSWLRAEGQAGTDESSLASGGDDAPFGAAHQPSDLLCRLLAVLSTGAAPHVWRCRPDVQVEVVERMDPLGVPTGGAVLVVTVAGVRLASRALTAQELAGPHPAGGDLADVGCGQEDLAVAVLGRAAQTAAEVVQGYRAAQLAVPPFTVEQATVLLDALHELGRSDVQPWTVQRELPPGAQPGSALQCRHGYERAMRHAGRVLQRLIDREPGSRSGWCRHTAGGSDRHGVPGVQQVPGSSRCPGDGCAVTCRVVDGAEVSGWRLVFGGTDQDGQVVAGDGVVADGTSPDEPAGGRAAELFDPGGGPDPAAPGTGGDGTGAAVDDV